MTMRNLLWWSAATFLWAACSADKDLAVGSALERERPAEAAEDSNVPVVVGGGSVAAADPLVASTAAVFVDANLETAVRTALGKTAGALSISEVAALEELVARGQGIGDLTGLEQAASLVFLDLADNEIDNLMPLAALSALQVLVLDANAIVDLAPLAGLAALEVLAVEYNRIADLAPLSALKSLETLLLLGNRVENLASLLALSADGALKRVDLRENPLGSAGFSDALADLRAAGVEVAVDIKEQQVVAPPVEVNALDFFQLQLLFRSRNNYFVYATDGSGLVETGLARSAFPTWAPDGERLVYLQEGEIFAAQVDGGGAEPVVESPAANIWYPLWSPDARRFAMLNFAQELARISLVGYPEPSVQHIDLGAELVGNEGYSIPPMAWSPEGTHLFLMVSNGLYLIDVETQAITALSEAAGEDGEPVWSPDGSRLAFVSWRSGNREIYVADLAGGGLLQLTDDPTSDTHPTWSADGRQIAFVSLRSGDADIYVVDAQGGEPVNMTQAPARDMNPTWSPDGSQIAFISNRDGNNKIYLLDARGGEPVLLLDRGVSGDLSWSPR